MIGSSQAVRIFARGRPTDLRKGYAGLAGVVQQEMGRELISGDLFLFVSKDRRSARVLHWDGSGLCMYSKRLAQGRFVPIWERAKGGAIRLTMAELSSFMVGSTREGSESKKLRLVR